MNSFDSAFEKVCRLVEDFKENESHYLSPKYNEQQARKDYIDRFFIALGWDVNHTEQRNPYRQEVKVEETQINQRRPDYTFYIEPKFKEPKFFVEAKKPSRNLKDAMFYYQTIRYARFASTPVAVLTDFEEFHVLDCRFKPDINTVLKNTNHKVFHYTDYADKEKFEKIYYLFSREEVSKNSLQDYSDSLPKLKIKGVQAAVLKLEQQSLDEEFLVYLDNVREKLAKAFKKNDLNLTSDELTEATQRTIDRLVFIRFLEDKLIEDDDYVSKLGLSKNSWSDFISLCKALNAKYNGIVFKEHFIDSQRFSGPELNGFADICLDFSQRNPNGYNYNLIPIHILGSIYERFLGKVVVATDKRVRIDEKPEVRKAGGVYYTPKYIVDYIVDNTVGKILRNETGDCHSCESRNPVKGKTPKEITKLRFADIACGSGSFLIGVFETLLEYHNNYYWNHHDEAKADGCLFKDGAPVLSIRQKQNILLNNIFGVDIDHQAVEVTQLSLALKMLEDETLATANEMQVLFHEKILPDLTKNIVCGNSLIGTDILEGKMFPSEEERKLNPMDFEKRFPEIIKSGGFDAIVGNPPYVRPHNLGDEVKKYFWKHYETFVKKSDLYSCFMQNAIILIKNGGYISFIVSDGWLRLDSFEILRKYILKNCKIVELVKLPDKVFKDATVKTGVFVFQKDKNKLSNEKNIIRINEYNTFGIFETKRIIQQQIFNTTFKSIFDTSLSAIIHNTKNRFWMNSAPLGDLADIKFGLKTGDDEKFITRNSTSKEHKRLLRGDNIQRYSYTYEGEYVWYVPYIMKEHRKTARPGEAARFEQPKILIKDTSSKLGGTLDFDNYYVKDVLVLTLKQNISVSLLFILGVLNSKAIRFYYESTFPTIHVQNDELASLPIPMIDFSKSFNIACYEKITQFVDQMLSSKRLLQEAKTEKDKSYYERKCADLDNAIDAEVYKLYGLTEEDIKIVEGKE